MTRRIVQIASWAYANASHQSFVGCHALYADGSIDECTNGDWTCIRLPDIPQDEPAVDPIAEIEERGAVLRIDWDTSRIVWAMDSDGMREPIATHMSDGSARLVHLRAAAARLLERIRGAK